MSYNCAVQIFQDEGLFLTIFVPIGAHPDELIPKIKDILKTADRSSSSQMLGRLRWDLLASHLASKLIFNESSKISSASSFIVLDKESVKYRNYDLDLRINSCYEDASLEIDAAIDIELKNAFDGKVVYSGALGSFQRKYTADEFGFFVSCNTITAAKSSRDSSGNYHMEILSEKEAVKSFEDDAFVVVDNISNFIKHKNAQKGLEYLSDNNLIILKVNDSKIELHKKPFLLDDYCEESETFQLLGEE